MPGHHAALAVPAFLALLAAPPASAQAPPTPDPSRSELTVFGGISLLDASVGSERTIGLPEWPGFPGFPGLPGRPGFGDVQVRTEAKIGSSALFGARYGFYLKKQLAVEVDFAVAPSHELKGDVSVCGPGGSCWGTGDYDRAGMADGFAGAMSGVFAGAAGGRFRGMQGMRRDRFDGDRAFGGADVTAWHYGAGVAYDVLGGDVRPFLTLGAGGVSYDGEWETETDLVVRFGGGLKVYFDRVGLRLDVVDHLVVDHYLTGGAEHDVHATAGVLVRF